MSAVLLGYSPGLRRWGGRAGVGMEKKKKTSRTVPSCRQADRLDKRDFFVAHLGILCFGV